MLPVKVAAGILCANKPLNSSVADTLLAFMFPEVRVMLPFSVKVFAPTVNVPDVNVSVFATVRL